MKKKKEKLNEQLVRALADYDNLKKRVEKEREGFYEMAVARFITKMLPVFDMLEQVQEHCHDSGLAMAMGELKESLMDEGIESIEPKVGDKFNEGMMEAVEVKESKSAKDGDVLKVNLKGWKMGDNNMIRYAKVVVCRKEK